MTKPSTILADMWDPEGAEKRPIIKEEVYYLTLTQPTKGCTLNAEEFATLTEKVKSGYFKTMDKAVKSARKIMNEFKTGVHINVTTVETEVLSGFTPVVPEGF